MDPKAISVHRKLINDDKILVGTRGGEILEFDTISAKSTVYLRNHFNGELKGNSRVQWRGARTPVCSAEGLTASQSAPNGPYGPYGHGTCMGKCVRSKIQSARAKKSRIKLPGSRWTLCVKWV